MNSSERAEILAWAKARAAKLATPSSPAVADEPNVILRYISRRAADEPLRIKSANSTAKLSWTVGTS